MRNYEWSAEEEQKLRQLYEGMMPIFEIYPQMQPKTHSQVRRKIWGMGLQRPSNRKARACYSGQFFKRKRGIAGEYGSTEYFRTNAQHAARAAQLQLLAYARAERKNNAV